MELKVKRTKRARNILRAFFVSVIVLAVAAVALVYLLTYVPKLYSPLQPSDSDEVNPYLTHYLAPNFHNNIVIDRPFDVIVPQKNLNEIIVDEDSMGWSWPYSLNGVTFSAPSMVFTDDSIVLMATVEYAGLPIVVSIIGSPKLDDEGMLALNIDKMTAGAVNITGVAKYLAGRIIPEQVNVVEDDQWLKDLAGAIESNAPFDPVFPVIGSDKHIRLTKAEITEGKLVLGFAPAN
jgi:hypothetical protein